MKCSIYSKPIVIVGIKNTQDHVYQPGKQKDKDIDIYIDISLSIDKEAYQLLNTTNQKYLKKLL